MCLLLIDWSTHSNYQLIVAANRDEFHARPSAGAAWWHDNEAILGGRDLEAQGTWMAVNRYGHFAAVTNVRKRGTGGVRSRGALAVDFLSAERPRIDTYLEHLAATANDYDGYNFIAFDGRALGWFNNVEGQHRLLSQGIYGLSNASLDTAWPKVLRLKDGYNAAIEHSGHVDDYLFGILEDKTVADDDSLPSTGVGLELERQLSPIFIEGQTYGTRCSTVYTLDRVGKARFWERRFDPSRHLLGETNEEFEIAVCAA